VAGQNTEYAFLLMFPTLWEMILFRDEIKNTPPKQELSRIVLNPEHDYEYAEIIKTELIYI